MPTKKDGKLLGGLIALTAIITAALIGIAFYFSSSSIHSLLTENHELNKAITNLSAETQIGYATVQSQSKTPTGTIETIVKFVQTSPENPNQIVSEQLFSIEGNMIFFDALIFLPPE